MKPACLSEKIIAQSRLFEVRELELMFSNGEKRTYERMCSRSPGAVLVVPMLDAKTVLLIKEYSAGLDRYELSLPKGLMDEGEDMFQSANRELMEETGYSAGKLQFIKTISLAPGYMTHITHLLFAEDLSPKKLQGDEPEPIAVVPWNINHLDELFARDDCTEGRTIAALLMAKQRLRDENA